MKEILRSSMTKTSRQKFPHTHLAINQQLRNLGLELRPMYVPSGHEVARFTSESDRERQYYLTRVCDG